MTMDFGQLQKLVAELPEAQQRALLGKKKAFNQDAFVARMQADKGTFVKGWCPEPHPITGNPQVMVECPNCGDEIPRQQSDIHLTIGDADPAGRWPEIPAGCPDCKKLNKKGGLGRLAKQVSKELGENPTPEDVKAILAKIMARTK